MVATGDKAAGADVVRSMAQRAKATITEVEGSHVIMISQPQAVADVILSALAAVGEAGEAQLVASNGRWLCRVSAWRLAAGDADRIGERKAGMSAAFASVKQIDAGVLSVGYAEDGPANGPAVLLLHGWPYDIHSYAEVAPSWRRRAIG